MTLRRAASCNDQKRKEEKEPDPMRRLSFLQKKMGRRTSSALSGKKAEMKGLVVRRKKKTLTSKEPESRRKSFTDRFIKPKLGKDSAPADSSGEGGQADLQRRSSFFAKLSKGESETKLAQKTVCLADFSDSDFEGDEWPYPLRRTSFYAKLAKGESETKLAKQKLGDAGSGRSNCEEDIEGAPGLSRRASFFAKLTRGESETELARRKLGSVDLGFPGSDCEDIEGAPGLPRRASFFAKLARGESETKLARRKMGSVDLDVDSGRSASVHGRNSDVEESTDLRRRTSFFEKLARGESETQLGAKKRSAAPRKLQPDTYVAAAAGGGGGGGGRIKVRGSLSQLAAKLSFMTQHTAYSSAASVASEGVDALLEEWDLETVRTASSDAAPPPGRGGAAAAAAAAVAAFPENPRATLDSLRPAPVVTSGLVGPDIPGAGGGGGGSGSGGGGGGRKAAAEEEALLGRHYLEGPEGAMAVFGLQQPPLTEAEVAAALRLVAGRRLPLAALVVRGTGPGAPGARGAAPFLARLPADVRAVAVEGEGEGTAPGEPDEAPAQGQGEGAAAAAATAAAAAAEAAAAGALCSPAAIREVLFALADSAKSADASDGPRRPSLGPTAEAAAAVSASELLHPRASLPFGAAAATPPGLVPGGGQAGKGRSPPSPPPPPPPPPQLWHVGLRGNRMGPDCGLHLAEMIRYRPGLKCIDLANNALDDEAILHIEAAVGKNHELQALNLEGNRLTDRGAAALAGLCRRRPRTLRRVLVARNPGITERGRKELQDALAGRPFFKFPDLLEGLAAFPPGPDPPAPAAEPAPPPGPPGAVHPLATPPPRKAATPRPKGSSPTESRLSQSCGASGPRTGRMATPSLSPSALRQPQETLALVRTGALLAPDDEGVRYGGGGGGGLPPRRRQYAAGAVKRSLSNLSAAGSSSSSSAGATDAPDPASPAGGGGGDDAGDSSRASRPSSHRASALQVLEKKLRDEMPKKSSDGSGCASTCSPTPSSEESIVVDEENSGVTKAKLIWQEEGPDPPTCSRAEFQRENSVVLPSSQVDLPKADEGNSSNGTLPSTKRSLLPVQASFRVRVPKLQNDDKEGGKRDETEGPTLSTMSSTQDKLLYRQMDRPISIKEGSCPSAALTSSRRSSLATQASFKIRVPKQRNDGDGEKLDERKGPTFPTPDSTRDEFPDRQMDPPKTEEDNIPKAAAVPSIRRASFKIRVPDLQNDGNNNGARDQKRDGPTLPTASATQRGGQAEESRPSTPVAADAESTMRQKASFKMMGRFVVMTDDEATEVTHPGDNGDAALDDTIKGTQEEVSLEGGKEQAKLDHVPHQRGHRQSINVLDFFCADERLREQSTALKKEEFLRGVI